MHKCLNAQRVHHDAFYENNADVIDQRATRANRLEIYMYVLFFMYEKERIACTLCDCILCLCDYHCDICMIMLQQY